MPSPADQRGASAVEFAIVAPMLITLLFAIVSFGWGMHSISSLRLALEEAGRALQLDPNLSEEQLASIIEKTLKAIGDPHVSVNLTMQEPVGDLQMAQITANYAFEITVPLLPTYQINFQSAVSVPLRDA